MNIFLGTTIDACQPVVNKKLKNNLIGVVCISFLTSEFVREDWSNTEHSYWFLIDENGTLMIFYLLNNNTMLTATKKKKEKKIFCSRLSTVSCFYFNL